MADNRTTDDAELVADLAASVKVWQAGVAGAIQLLRSIHCENSSPVMFELQKGLAISHLENAILLSDSLLKVVRRLSNGGCHTRSDHQNRPGTDSG